VSLTTDEMIQIQVDLMNDKTPRVTGPDADAYRQSLEGDIAKAKKEGWSLDVPKEWPDMPDDKPAAGSVGDKPPAPVSDSQTSSKVAPATTGTQTSIARAAYEQVSGALGGAGTVTVRIKGVPMNKSQRTHKTGDSDVAVRITVDDMDALKTATQLVRRNLRIVDEDDYSDGHPSGSGYRAVHYTIDVDGQSVELLIRTQNQTRWADWAHDVIQNPSLRNDPAVLNYARRLGDHFHAKDSGKYHIPKPDCPPAVQQAQLCL